MTRRLSVFFAFQFLLYQCANRAACKDPLEFQYKWLDENNNLTDEKDSRMADDNNNNKPLIVFIHGYFTSLQNPYYAIFGKSLAKWTGSRVAFVGWSDWTLGVIYPELVQKMPGLANRLADWLNGLRDRGTLKSFDQVTLIGHSLGAQMIGLVGHRFNGTFKRIIALDPAGPWFTAAAKNERVDKKSGRFVMVLHTSTTIWGLREPTGHVDFYFDGGKKQTLCGLDLDSMCSHVVVFEYFIQSLRNSSALKAQRCRTLEDCEAKTVDSNEPAVYMTINLSPTTRGLYSITPTKNVLDLIELHSDDLVPFINAFGKSIEQMFS